MANKLKCFISASQQDDTSLIKDVLAENNVDVTDFYDLSIGESFQNILKQKIRKVDFVLFILTEESKYIYYEIGICEGMGKQHFVLFGKEIKVPFYFENKLFQRANLDDKNFLDLSIKNILNKVNKNWKPRHRTKPDIDYTYSDNTIERLKFHLNWINHYRNNDAEENDLYILIEELFKTVKLNYVKNFSDFDKGVDFALWSNELGRIIGNPIIIEIKYGNLSKNSFKNAEEQLKNYASKADARLALLLYLDKNNKRFKVQPSLNPLIISYDLEDFLNDLIKQPFENLVLSQRNNIAHGIE